MYTVFTYFEMFEFVVSWMRSGSEYSIKYLLVYDWFSSYPLNGRPSIIYALKNKNPVANIHIQTELNYTAYTLHISLKIKNKYDKTLA